ncbi:hypothetical protein NEUTE2DRAFT_111453 [Neurospora tetrasperma FGSC 2509]|nr:hypothetical protein NEUTE2DRAFT_111453 [Neurospora tetrasperma FGSC 2509]
MESRPRTEISRAGMSTNRLSRMLKRVQCTNMTIGMKHSPLSGPSYLPISSSLNFFHFSPNILSPEPTAKGASSIDWPRVSPIVVVIAPAVRLGPARLGGGGPVSVEASSSVDDRIGGGSGRGADSIDSRNRALASVHFTLILSAISKLSAGHIGMVLKLKNEHLRSLPTPMKGKGPVPACFVINSRALRFRAPVTKGPSASLLQDSQAPIYYTTLHVGCPSPVWSVKRVDYSDTT